jgi:hypothetical protein
MYLRAFAPAAVTLGRFFLSLPWWEVGKSSFPFLSG